MTPNTHDLDLPASVYDELVASPLAMLNLALFDDAVAEDDWVRLTCPDDGRSVVGRVTAVAAAVEFVEGML